VHVGTLLVVIIVFRSQVYAILRSLSGFIYLLFKKKNLSDHLNQDTDFKLALLIVAGSIPTAVLGLLFHQIIDRLFSSLVMVGSMLLVTGVILWGTRYASKGVKTIARFSVKDALIIGLTQGFAILPGISRSGSTIAAGLFLGLRRETAAGYSFLLSIPAILGAEILTFKDLSSNISMPVNIILLGALVAFVVGYLALKLLLYIVKKGQMHSFAPYCWVVGALALFLGLFY